VPDGRPYDGTVTFSTGEILVALGVGVVLAAVIGAYMVVSRKKGWM
jgi:hypothetical protein